MLLESRRIAILMLTHPDEPTWRQSIEFDNILQKDSVATAIRQSSLIRKRLLTLDSYALELIVEKDSEVGIQLLFAAALKQDNLLSDFMRKVYGSCRRRMDPVITTSNWEDFLIECSHRDVAVSGWNSNTKLKIFNGITKVLAEARFLVDRKSRSLSHQELHPKVRHYLLSRNERAILECLEFE